MADFFCDLPIGKTYFEAEFDLFNIGEFAGVEFDLFSIVSFAGTKFGDVL